MVHLPFVMGAIAVFHSVPDTTVANPIHLDACTLAKVRLPGALGENAFFAPKMHLFD